MNNTIVPNSGESPAKSSLSSLAAELDRLTPEVRKAASYVLENPNDVGVSSIREIAKAAGVTPNTFVRMARSAGFDGYDDFREPFRESIRNGGGRFARSRALAAIDWSTR